MVKKKPKAKAKPKAASKPRSAWWLKISVLIIIAIIVITSGVAGWLFLRAMPNYAGNAAISGLSAPVRIVRDEHGVPHIFASNMKDAARALGYVHASERLFQMEMQRRAGQGRLSEIIGADMLGVDKYIRTLGLYHLAETSYAAMSPEAQKFFQAYADGVNSWLDSHPHNLPPEFLILGDTPEPWKPADSVVWGKLMAIELSKNYHLEILRAQLAQKLSPSQIGTLFAMPADMPITTASKVEEQSSTQEQSSSPPLAGGAGGGGVTQSGSLSNYIQASGLLNAPPPNLPREGGGTRSLSPEIILAKFLGLDHAASNEWVISGKRTVSGKPILANDPHLGLEAPVLWYLARIVTPGFTIKGATVPGLPIVLLGQNDRIAWGFTTTGSDVQDLFTETVDPQNAAHYITPDGSKPFETRTETIHVKDAADVTLKVRTTRHGPVMSDIDPKLTALAGKGKVMALAFTALGPKDTTSESLMRLNRAKNWDEFLAALQLYQAPPQNIVYADMGGHIGYINPGIVPVRKQGNGLIPADGASGDYDWVDTIPFGQLPQILDPEPGYIFNANNQIAGADYPYFMGIDWEEPYRAQRLQQYFDNPRKQTLDTSAAMQADHISLAARQLLPYLLAQKTKDTRQADALKMLHGWDGTMDKSRAEPLIFEAWLYEMHEMLLVQKAGISLEEKGPYDAVAISSILAADAHGRGSDNWCGKAGCSTVTLNALDAALDLLTQRDGADMQSWHWGSEHITQLRHKFYRHIPILKNISNLDIPSSGDYYTLDRGGGRTEPDSPFARTHGGGFRGLYDLGNPAQSRFMITTGESGHIFSKHYGDLVPAWNNVQSFTLTGTHDELIGRGLPELVLKPR